MRRRHFLRTMAVGGGLVSTQMLLGRAQGQSADAQTQTAARGRGPIIDVHMHAYPASEAIDGSLSNPVTRKPPGLKDGEAHMRACLAEMQRLNIVTGIVSGGTGDRLAAAMHWHDAAPDRIIAGAGVRGSEDTPLPELGVLRKAFADRRLRVLGEVTAEYAGQTLSDPQYEAYLALAEEFDVPVALHTATFPPGTSYDRCCRNARVRLGNPALIEEALNRHPKLRVNLMHAAWPYLEETIALMSVYPQVYADLGWCAWGLPRAEFYAYLGALTRAGFSQRVMFGSDQQYWPDLIGVSVDTVDSAPFLTAAEKRDIFHDNAVRFYKLETSAR
jgi:predicted TIM-barrel fold metal-dependent hydrolase